MATEWISPTWRMPENNNQSKVDNYSIDEIYNATSSGKTADLSTMATPPIAWYRMGD